MSHLVNLYVNEGFFALREVFKDQVLLKYHLKYTKICKRSDFYDICFFYLYLQI